MYKIFSPSLPSRSTSFPFASKCLEKVATIDEYDFNRTKACHSFLCDCVLPCNVVCSSSLHFHVKMMVGSAMAGFVRGQRCSLYKVSVCSDFWRENLEAKSTLGFFRHKFSCCVKTKNSKLKNLPITQIKK